MGFGPRCRNKSESTQRVTTPRPENVVQHGELENPQESGRRAQRILGTEVKEKGAGLEEEAAAVQQFWLVPLKTKSVKGGRRRGQLDVDLGSPHTHVAAAFPGELGQPAADKARKVLESFTDDRVRIEAYMAWKRGRSVDLHGQSQEIEATLTQIRETRGSDTAPRPEVARVVEYG